MVPCTSDDTVGPCPDEQMVTDWLEGRSSPTQRAALEEHFASCSSCRELTSALAKLSHRADGPSEGTGEPPEVLAPLRRGDSIDRYLVLDAIGAGAMGVVYLAYDPKLDRRIALKLLGPRLHASADAAAARARLSREAHAMARVSSAHVVAVHDVGAFGDHIYVVMEHVDGMTLTAWSSVDRAWREKLAMFLQAGEGLAAVHDAGLVHRDFKPDNVLVSKDGRARVTDFGLARFALAADEVVARSSSSDEGDAAVLLSRSGMVFGTPAYMAPEQLDRGSVDARSDQFGFCVALYEAICGEAPFEGRDVAELASARRQGRARTPARVPAGAGYLMPALLRGLSPDPAMRHPDMRSLLASLANDPGRRRRRATGWAAALVVVAAGVVGAGALLRARARQCESSATAALTGIWDAATRHRIHDTFERGAKNGSQAWQRVEVGVDRYVEQWRRARSATCTAARERPTSPNPRLAQESGCLDRRLDALRALTELLVKADPLTVENATKAVEELDPIRTCLGSAGGLGSTGTAVNGALSEQLAQARILRSLGRTRAALELADRVSEQAAREHAPEEARAILWRGELHMYIGDSIAKAAELFRKAALLAEERHDDETRASAYVQLVGAYGQSTSAADQALAEHYAGLAAAALKRLGDASALDASLEDFVAGLEFRREHFDAALAHEKRAIQLLDAHPEEHGFLRSRLLCNMGTIDGEMGHPAEALPYFERSLQIAEAITGNSHPDLVLMLGSIGETLLKLGRPVEARAQLERALTINETSLGSENDRQVYLLMLFAECLATVGDLERAPAVWQQAIAIADRLSDRDIARITPRVSLGTFYVEHGRPALAVRVLEEALAGERAAPETKAAAEFALARALTETHEDPTRAVRLATDARAIYAAAGDRRRAELAAVDTWIAGHLGVTRLR